MIRRSASICHLFLLLVLVPSSYGEPLSLEEVVKSVQAHHPVIQIAEIERERARAASQIAEGAFDLQLSAKGVAMPKGYYDSSRVSAGAQQQLAWGGVRLFSEYGLSNGDWPIYEGKNITHNGGEFIVGLEVPLLRDQAVDPSRTGRGVARAGEVAADRSARQRIIEQALRGSDAYLNWIAAGMQRRVYHELLQVAESRSAQFRERAQAGDLARFDVIDNERLELQRKAQLIKAEEALASAAIVLSLFLRDAAGVPRLPSESLLPSSLSKVIAVSIPEPEAAYHAALSARPDLARLMAQREQAVAELALAENQILPELDLRVAAARNLGQGLVENDETELVSGLEFKVPFQRNDAKGKFRAAETKVREVDTSMVFLKERVKAEIEDAWQIIRRAKERLDLARQEAGAARELEKGERERLRMGDSNLVVVNIREQTAAESSLREISAELEYLKAKLIYRAATGLLPIEE